MVTSLKFYFHGESVPLESKMLEHRTLSWERFRYFKELIDLQVFFAKGLASIYHKLRSMLRKSLIGFNSVG
jgi:hypothetical protein